MAEKEQPKLTDEQKTEMVKVQKDIFKNEYLRTLALTDSKNLEFYGDFGKNLEKIGYAKAPDELGYEISGMRKALIDDEPITGKILKQNARNYWTSSIGYQKGSDLAKEMGAKIDEKYSKLVSELDKESQGALVNSFFQYQTTGIIQSALDEQQKGIGKNLESLLGPKEKPKEKQ